MIVAMYIAAGVCGFLSLPVVFWAFARLCLWAQHSWNMAHLQASERESIAKHRRELMLRAATCDAEKEHG